MGMTCGTCRRFSALRDGGLVGTCSAGPCKRGGSAPCVTASMDAEGCPDYSQIDRRLVAAMERSKDMAGSLDRLSDALFEQLDRLGGLDLADTERVDAELERASAVCKVASAITANNATAMAAVRMQADLGIGKAEMPRLLGQSDA